MARVSERAPAIRVVLLPRDTNEVGTIFGGVIMSLVDQAGAIEAHKHADGRVVTVAVRELVFQKPVFVGDIVSCYTSTKKLGTTSVTVKVEVDVQRRSDRSVTERVTEAEIVFVAVDAQMRPKALRG
jgi:acyl-CoA thioesterase YciA